MKKTEISVIEFDYHPEVLRDFCKIMENTDFRINIFTAEDIWGKVLSDDTVIPENFQLFLKKKSLSVPEFVNSNCKKLNNSDIIIFNTIASNFRFFYNLALKPITIVRIHNANACFNKLVYSYKPRFTLFYLWKDFSHFIRKTIGKLDWYYRRKFLEKVNYYAFPNKVILNYAIENYDIPKSKAIILPMSFTPDDKIMKKKEASDVTTIAIIGKVDQRNRDYILLYRALKIALKRSSKVIKLVLLGVSSSCYGKKIIKLFKSLESDNFTLVSFKKFVEQSVFVNCIDQSDFFIIPVKIKTRYTIYSEIYGLTKISGNINDILKHKKPALISSGYHIENNLKSIVEPFEDEYDLATKIIYWCENKKYDSMFIDEALENYKLKNIQNHFTKITDSILLQTY
ncbi:MAG: glycosyltransferase [Bacteroidales bacterium]|nr:glycosyltransferase [Bacteroidales bacterium]